MYRSRSVHIALTAVHAESCKVLDKWPLDGRADTKYAFGVGKGESSSLGELGELLEYQRENSKMRRIQDSRRNIVTTTTTTTVYAV